jgi:hypothetical protein
MSASCLRCGVTISAATGPSPPSKSGRSLTGPLHFTTCYFASPATRAVSLPNDSAHGCAASRAELSATFGWYRVRAERVATRRASSCAADSKIRSRSDKGTSRHAELAEVETISSLRVKLAVTLYRPALKMLPLAPFPHRYRTDQWSIWLSSLALIFCDVARLRWAT